MYLRTLTCLIFLLAAALATAQNEPAKGSLLVRVKLDAEPPRLPQVVVHKNMEFCGETLEDPVLLVKNRAIQNVIVSLEWQGGKTLVKPKPLELKSQHCLMEPRIQSSETGVILLINSGDPITHSPHGWWNDERTVFNLTLLDPKLSFKRKLSWPGLYRVDCDTHTWMRSYIWVFDHPYHGVTNAEGAVNLVDLPVGKWRAKAWHEILGEQTQEITIRPGAQSKWSPLFSFADKRAGKLRPETRTPWPPTHSGGSHD